MTRDQQGESEDAFECAECRLPHFSFLTWCFPAPSPCSLLLPWQHLRDRILHAPSSTPVSFLLLRLAASVQTVCVCVRYIAAERCQPNSVLQANYHSLTTELKATTQNVATWVKLVTLSQSNTLLHTWVHLLYKSHNCQEKVHVTLGGKKRKSYNISTSHFKKKRSF